MTLQRLLIYALGLGAAALTSYGAPWTLPACFLCGSWAMFFADHLEDRS